MRLLANRKESEPDKTRWALWRWLDIKDKFNGDLYLTRLTIFRCPLFQVLLHWIHRPDPTEDLHDHPWAFVGAVIDGGYTEVTGTPHEDKLINTDANKVDFLIKKTDPTEAHSIVAVQPGTKTLILTGPRRREWSFYTPLGKKPGDGDVLAVQTPWRDRL